MSLTSVTGEPMSLMSDFVFGTAPNERPVHWGRSRKPPEALKKYQNVCLFFFDRFKLICDGASACAMAGNYTIDDEILVRSKAKTILDCYIESMLPPKVQVGIRIVK